MTVQAGEDIQATEDRRPIPLEAPGQSPPKLCYQAALGHSICFLQ